MALTQCPDCGGKVSTRVEACPHCGAPKSTPKPTSGQGLGPWKHKPIATGYKVTWTIWALVFWVWFVRRAFTGAPDNSMGLLDMIPVVFIGWLWSAKGPTSDSGFGKMTVSIFSRKSLTKGFGVYFLLLAILFGFIWLLGR
jgi:hypothetical protein